MHARRLFGRLSLVLWLAATKSAAFLYVAPSYATFQADTTSLPSRGKDTARCFSRGTTPVNQYQRSRARCLLLRESGSNGGEKLNTTTSEDTEDEWQTMGSIATVSSPWMNIHCERLRDNRGQVIDYWRVEKDHSVIVMTIYKNRLIFPRKQYRPGLGEITLDFCGGRLPSGMEPRDVIPSILHREMGLSETYLDDLSGLRSSGWSINSSFSNQRLFGFVALLSDTVELDPSMLHPTSYNVNDPIEIDTLLDELSCLQCRAVFMEYLLRRRG
jgi:hypothetical protein